MRRLAALLVLAASACADGGVVVEVKPTDPAVDSVRVFVGRYDRTEDATLEVPTAATANGVVRTAVPGITYFPRDSQNELDTKAIKSGETVKFVFVRDDVTDLGAIIAVGYAGTQIKEVATLFDVHLPATRFEQYTLQLAAPARPPVAWGDQFPGPANEAACIGITDPATKDPFSVSYIVTPFDQDCDGLDENDPAECNNDAWFGKRPASLEELTCLVPSPDQTSCFLGGPECVDGKGKTASQCLPTPYCVPRSVCGLCNGNLACAKDVTTNANVPPGNRSPGFDCTLRNEAGNTCEDELVLAMGAIDGLDCKSALIADAKHDFADQLDLGNQQIYVKIDPGCQIRLVVKGKAPDPAVVDIGLMVAVELSNGRGVAAPVVIHVDRQSTTCTEQPVFCQLDQAMVAPELAECAAPWAVPAIEPGLVPQGSTNVRSPSLTSDELEIWFVADGNKIYHSTRPSKIAAWSPPQPDSALSAIAIGQTTTAARVSPDGLAMYISGLRTPTIGGDEIYMATRTSRSEGWSQPIPAGMVNTIKNELGGSVDGGGHILTYSADVDIGPATFSRLFLATRGTSGGLWGAGTSITGNGSAANDYNPHVTEDGRAIYFSSNLIDGKGHELFVLARPAGGGGFGMPRHLLALSSDKDDDDPWVTADQRTIYFASNRGSGNFRIYRATR